MAKKILTRLNKGDTNNDFYVVHGAKINGLPGVQTIAKANDNGILDLSPLIPTITASDLSKALAINSEGTALVWKVTGKVDDVKTGTVSRVDAANVANLPPMSKGSGLNSIVFGSDNAVNADPAAAGNYSIAEGYQTVAAQDFQHVQGQYNVEDTTGLYADIVGWGSDAAHKKNISSLTTQGDLHLKGNVYIQSDNDGRNGIKLVPEVSPASANFVLAVNSEGTQLEWVDVGLGADGGANWHENNTNSPNFIKNKPAIKQNGGPAIAVGSTGVILNDMRYSNALGLYATVEGLRNSATGDSSHVEGSNNSTSIDAVNAHVEGTNNSALFPEQHIQGKYAVEDSEGLFADVVGWGTAGARKNISSLMTNGDLHLKGDLYIQADDDGKNGIRLLPTVGAANIGKALIVNSEGNGLEWGEAGKVDDVQINGVSIVKNKEANINLGPTARPTLVFSNSEDMLTVDIYAALPPVITGTTEGNVLALNSENELEWFELDPSIKDEVKSDSVSYPIYMSTTTTANDKVQKIAKPAEAVLSFNPSTKKTKYTTTDGTALEFGLVKVATW